LIEKSLCLEAIAGITDFNPPHTLSNVRELFPFALVEEGGPTEAHIQILHGVGFELRIDFFGVLDHLELLKRTFDRTCLLLPC